MPIKTGLVVTTIMLEHIARLWIRYGDIATSTVNAALAAGTINATQHANILAFFSALNDLVVAMRLVTGY